MPKAFGELINISLGVPKPQLEKWREYILEFFFKSNVCISITFLKNIFTLTHAAYSSLGEFFVRLAKSCEKVYTLHSIEERVKLLNTTYIHSAFCLCLCSQYEFIFRLVYLHL